MCHALTFGFLGFWIEDHSKIAKSANVFVVYEVEYHSDVPLLKFSKSVNRIKSYVERSEMVQFFEIADFLKDLFWKTHDQHSF